MVIQVRVSDTHRLPDPTGMDMGIIFYLWLTLIPDLNRDGNGAGIFSHPQVNRRVSDTLIPL
jgi:hypothetical protein